MKLRSTINFVSGATHCIELVFQYLINQEREESLEIVPYSYQDKGPMLMLDIESCHNLRESNEVGSILAKQEVQRNSTKPGPHASVYDLLSYLFLCICALFPFMN